MSLSEEIIIVRKKGFCTQTEFAEQVGVSFSTVNRWETGKMNPNASAMKRIKAYCEALNIEFGGVEKAWIDRDSEETENDKHNT